MWRADPSLGKLILAPKWHPAERGEADFSTEIVVTHDLYGSEFGETHFYSFWRPTVEVRSGFLDTTIVTD